MRFKEGRKMEKTEANIADIDDLIFENEEIRQSER